MERGRGPSPRPRRPGLRHLARAPRLETLDLEGTAVTEGGARWLCAALPRLRLVR